MIKKKSSALVESLSESVKITGRYFLFTKESIWWAFQRPVRYSEFFKHMEFIGNKSVFIICLTGFFTGMVLSFQIYLGFHLINADNLVGPTVALGIFRELGPVLTGIIVAARAGGAMAARLGTMRVTEQIDALDVMGINPKQYLVAPRILAATIATPMLTAIFDFVAMLGSYLLGVYFLGLDKALFIEKVRQMIDPQHINEGLFKALCFGFIFGSLCTFRGYNTSGGAKGVGEATNAGVVSSMVTIIVCDFFLTKMIRIYIGWFL